MKKNSKKIQAEFKSQLQLKTAELQKMTTKASDAEVRAKAVGDRLAEAQVRLQAKIDELSRLKSELKDMKGRHKDALAKAEAEKKRLVGDFEYCLQRFVDNNNNNKGEKERNSCSDQKKQQLRQSREMNEKLLSAHESANQKEAVSKEKLKKVKAELTAARQKELALKEKLKKMEAELAQTCVTVNERARGKGREHEEIEALRSEILATVKENNSVTMAAVGGMKDVKEALLDAIVLPKKSAQRPGLALLYGPSGTGV